MPGHGHGREEHAGRPRRGPRPVGAARRGARRGPRRVRSGRSRGTPPPGRATAIPARGRLDRRFGGQPHDRARRGRPGGSAAPGRRGSAPRPDAPARVPHRGAASSGSSMGGRCASTAASVMVIWGFASGRAVPAAGDVRADGVGERRTVALPVDARLDDRVAARPSQGRGPSDDHRCVVDLHGLEHPQAQLTGRDDDGAVARDGLPAGLPVGQPQSAPARSRPSRTRPLAGRSARWSPRGSTPRRPPKPASCPMGAP